MAPNWYGSSTTGVKKSRVATRARSSATRYTPASSAWEVPTRTLGSFGAGRADNIRARTPCPIFDAQPAHDDRCVRNIFSLSVNGPPPPSGRLADRDLDFRQH